MSLPFSGKRALVTGGATGIGLAIARGLSTQGCQTIVTGLGLEGDSSRFAEEPNMTAVELDVTKGDSIQQVVAQIPELDILVNSAGIILREGQEHQPEAFARVIDINLNGVMRMCSACKPLLARRRGCVLNIASMLSFFGSGNVPAYSASKGGVAQLTKSLAIAWAEDGVRVNAIAPGWIRTALTKPLYENEANARGIVNRTPMKRWGEPEDVAGAAVFLCSPAAAFITGVILPVDGGYSIQ